MLKSFALIFVLGLLFAKVFEKIKLPRIVGMLLVGIIIGPYCLNLLDANTLLISAELRKIALVIILIKAGLSLDLADLKKVGRPAILLSFLPATFEIIGFIIIGTKIFNISIIDAAIIGSILGAVSPAVVVPKMVYLMDNNYGTSKAIPQLILAGSSLDDVYVIVLFTSFVAMAQGGQINIMSFVDIPVSIVLGVILGIVAGMFLVFVYKKIEMTNTRKVILLFGMSLFLMAAESMLDGVVSVSGLLAVMACSMYIKAKGEYAQNVAKAYGEVWNAFELILFVLVGAAVNINYALNYGVKAVIAILLALAVRSVGTYISVLGTKLNKKERLFVVISYLPKATVQAAIGSVPLALGLGCGDLALSIAVVSILLTAPLGAFGIDVSHKKLLTHDI